VYDLVTNMYSTVLQAYIDEVLKYWSIFYWDLPHIRSQQCLWEEGLRAVDHALWTTPKAIHTELIPYKLVFKARMGKSVESDLIRFQVGTIVIMTCTSYVILFILVHSLIDNNRTIV